MSKTYNILQRCVLCGSDKIFSERKDQSFRFGKGPDSISLTVNVNVHTCEGCKFSFTDNEAEVARYKAICTYLNISEEDDERENL